LGELIGEAGMENMCQYQQVPPNRTPMQLDGAITTPGAMTELLVQSHLDVIEVLPALPASWKNGSIAGVRTRFGWEINVQWSSGHLTSVVVKAQRPGENVIRYGDKQVILRLEKNESVMLGADLVQAAT
jgi:alpha-L-fucosidase 2